MRLVCVEENMLDRRQGVDGPVGRTMTRRLAAQEGHIVGRRGCSHERAAREGNIKDQQLQPAQNH